MKTVYLGLILSAHFGLLSLAFGYNWIKLFYFQHRTSLLLSALVLSAAYIASQAFTRVPYHREKLRSLLLYAATAVGFASLLYAVFFAQKATQQIIASTLLFLAAIATAAFCESRKTNAIWKNLHRALKTVLLLAVFTFLYMHQELIFHLTPSLSATSGQENKFKMERSLTHTAFYNVELTNYYMSSYYLPAKLSNIPGHISALDNKTFLMIERYGNIYLLTLRKNTDSGHPEEELYIKKLSAVFPINYGELYSSEASEKVTKSFFRINDLYTDTEDGRQRLYVSHHFWNAEKECFTLRISKLADDVSALLNDNSSPEWRTLYETAPCFPVNKTGIAFVGHQAGGRIVGLDENTLLFSVGDHGFDTFGGSENFPQDINNTYGKIWKIDRDTGEADLISLGHRNPQGLYRAPDGSIWETEHGPESGDELNKIKPGKNYGWPHVLYGTQYGHFTWPRGTSQDGHESYEQPAFVWTPAIAVSNLIGVEGDLFPLWKNDLLVGSLKSKTLFRLQMHEDRVIYSEPIRIGYRIRDIVETPNGEIFMWTDSRSMIRLRPVNSLPKENETIGEAGERLFYKCAGCHSIKPDAPHGIGPNLYKVYKSPIARHREYHYSPALQARAAEQWTREKLDLFLKDPDAFAPGTTMQMKIPDDHERRVLLHHLENH